MTCIQVFDCESDAPAAHVAKKDYYNFPDAIVTRSDRLQRGCVEQASVTVKPAWFTEVMF